MPAPERVAKALKKEKSAALVAFCVLAWLALGGVGYHVFTEVTSFHPFWAVCAAASASGGLCWALFNAWNTAAQTDRFLARLEHESDPHALAPGYVKAVGLRPSSESGDVAPTVAMWLALSLFIIGLYLFPWEPSGLGGKIARVVVVGIASLAVAFVAAFVLDIGPSRCERRVQRAIGGLAPDLLRSFRLVLQGIRKSQDKVGRLLFGLTGDRKGEKPGASQSRARAWLSLAALAAAEREKVVRVVVIQSVV